MTEKELKKMNRRELLELLMVQKERGDRLQAQVEKLTRQLEEKRLRYAKAGTLADAAMQMSGIYGAAQKAADTYLENIRQMEEETTRRSQAILDDAAKKSQAMLEETRRECERQKQQIDAYLEEAVGRVRRQRQILDELFGDADDPQEGP